MVDVLGDTCTVNFTTFSGGDDPNVAGTFSASLRGGDPQELIEVAGSFDLQQPSFY